MATTNWATVYGTAGGGGRRPWVNWRVSAQSTANNTSTVQFQVGSQAVASAYTWGTFSGTFTANGTSNSISIQVPSGANQTMLTTSRTVKHNSDGKKSISFSLTGSIPGTTGWTSTSLSKTVTLPTIPRATTSTFTGSVAAGSSLKISTPRASTAFTHDVAYKYSGDSTYTNIATGVGTSTTWAVPLSLCSKIPKATSGTWNIRTITKQGTTTIGTTTKNLTVTVPTSVVPTLSSITASDPTTVFGKIGAYVQGKSKVRVTPTGAAGAQGSTITGYEITVGSTTTTTTGSGAADVPANTVGTSVAVKARAIDSRGRKSVQRSASNITVLSYIPPQITSFTAYRSDGTGAETQLGTKATARYSGSVASLKVGSTEKNTATIVVRTRRSGTTGSWSNNTVLTAGTPTTWTNATKTASQTIPIDQQFDVEVLFSDKLTSNVTKSTVVPVAQTAMSWGKSGVGVGTIWEDNSRGALQVVGGANLDYRYFPAYTASGRSIEEYIAFNNGLRIETVERATESGLSTPIKAGNHFGVLYTTSSLSQSSTYFGLTQRFFCSRCNNSWLRVTDSKTTWGPWVPISLEDPNKIVIDGVAYKRTGRMAVTRPTLGTVAGGAAAAWEINPPFVPPEGWGFQAHTPFTNGYGFVFFADKGQPVTDGKLRLRFWANSASATLDSIGWTLVKIS